MLHTAEYEFRDNMSVTPAVMLSGELRDSYISYNGWLIESIIVAAPVVLDGSMEGFNYLTYSNWGAENITVAAPILKDGDIVIALVTYSNWRTEEFTVSAPIILDGTFT